LGNGCAGKKKIRRGRGPRTKIRWSWKNHDDQGFSSERVLVAEMGRLWLAPLGGKKKKSWLKKRGRGEKAPFSFKQLPAYLREGRISLLRILLGEKKGGGGETLPTPIKKGFSVQYFVCSTGKTLPSCRTSTGKKGGGKKGREKGVGKGSNNILEKISEKTEDSCLPPSFHGVRGERRRGEAPHLSATRKGGEGLVEAVKDDHRGKKKTQKKPRPEICGGKGKDVFWEERAS